MNKFFIQFLRLFILALIAWGIVSLVKYLVGA